jgi:hypothetical protein
MFNEIRCSLCLLAGLLTLGVAAPSTASPPADYPGPVALPSTSKPSPAQPRVARFDLQFVATQSTRWFYDEQDYDPCGGGVVRNHGAGFQTMVVRIPKVRVTVARVSEVIIGDTVTRMWPRGSRKDFLAPWKVSVRVNRSATGSSETVVPPEGPCAEGPPDVQEPESDCGIRTLRGRLDLLPPFARQGLGLGIDTGGPYMAGGFEDLLGTAYAQCGFRGPSGLQKTGMAVISARKLFGKNPRLVAFDKRQSNSGSGGNRSETTTNWRMVLTRVDRSK